MPAKPRPPKPKNIAYTKFIGPDEYCVLSSGRVIHIHPNTGAQTEISLEQLESLAQMARSVQTNIRAQHADAQRELSQNIVSREKKAR